MPFLVKFLIRHALVGLGIAVLAVSLMLWTDFSGLGTLIGSSDQPVLVLALLTAMMGLTFSSLQMGFAIMLLPGDERSGPDKGFHASGIPAKAEVFSQRPRSGDRR